MSETRGQPFRLTGKGLLHPLAHWIVTHPSLRRSLGRLLDRIPGLKQRLRQAAVNSLQAGQAPAGFPPSDELTPRGRSLLSGLQSSIEQRGSHS